jgi:hypothetical protein
VKLLREPLLHFLFLGAAIYLAYGLFAEPAADMEGDTLVVSAGEIEWMLTSWAKRWNRPPTADELEGLIQQYIRETVLYREALAMGLDKDDTVIRRRLAQKLEFLVQDLPTLTPPSEADLQAYFEAHRERYQEPAQYTFTQVYVDPDKRGNATLDDARAIKSALMAQPDPIADAGEQGDGLLLQAHFPQNTRADIEKLFGSGFSELVVELPPGEWHGPVLSGYGVHLVYVHNISEPPVPAFTDVRARVQQDWEDERRQTMNEQFYAGLRDRYTIVIEQITPEPEKVAAVQE